MSDVTGSESQGLEEGTGTETVDQQVTEPAEQAAPSGGNPAWGSLKADLDDLTFARIEPHLKEFDKAAQSRIESLNSQFAPWKSLADQGVTPDRALAAANLAAQIDSDPNTVYESLGKFIQENGFAPTKDQLAQQVAEDQNDDDQSPEDDPRFAALAEGQEQMRLFLEAQAEQQLADRADAELDTELQTFTTAHPELSKADIGAILKSAAATAVVNAQNGSSKIPTLEEAAKDFFDLRTRILSTPRPGATAPLLAPTSGGVPAAQNQKTYGQMSNQETQDLMAALIESSRDRG